jgi:hypothetical protein
MRVLPFADPGEPDLRSPGRFLVWVGRGQVRTLVGGMAFGVVWMVAMALTPAAVGEAIDSGIRPHDLHRLVDWLGVIAGLVAVQAAASVVRHRFAVTNWMLAAFRSAQLLGEHVARAPARSPTGSRPVTWSTPWGRTSCGSARRSTTRPGSWGRWSAGSSWPA